MAYAVGHVFAILVIFLRLAFIWGSKGANLNILESQRTATFLTFQATLI